MDMENYLEDEEGGDKQNKQMTRSLNELKNIKSKQRKKT
jgi:hypothetical protein